MWLQAMQNSMSSISLFQITYHRSISLLPYDFCNLFVQIKRRTWILREKAPK